MLKICHDFKKMYLHDTAHNISLIDKIYTLNASLKN